MEHADGTFSCPLGGNEEGVVTCYMSKCDWDYELGCNGRGNKLYPSVTSILRHDRTMPYYGVVEVEVRQKRVVLREEYGPKRGEVTTRIRDNPDGTKTEEHGYIDDDLKFVVESTQTWTPKDPEYWGHGDKQKIDRKHSLMWHLGMADKLGLKDPEEYKRGLLQAALTFDIIGDPEWIELVKEHCPTWAK